MPYRDDEAERRRQALMSGGAAPMSVGSGPSPASTGPREVSTSAATPGSGFVNLQSYFDANRAGAQGMADDLAGDLDKRGGDVQGGLGRLQNQLGLARTLGSGAESIEGLTGYEPLARQGMELQQRAQVLGQGGAGTLLADKYGRGAGYTGGMSRLDAALAGMAGGQRLAQTANRWNDLAGQFGAAREYRAPASSSTPGWEPRTVQTPTPAGPQPLASGPEGLGATGFESTPFGTRRWRQRDFAERKRDRYGRELP